jgi:hypothetical protein
MQLGGIFDNDYELSIFTTFNMNNLSNIHRNNRARTQLLTRTGPLNLTSDMCTVTQFAMDNADANISLRVSEEFNQFINQLETTVYRLYYRDNISKRLSSDTLNIKLSIPMYKIENQIKFGNSILRSHRGLGLNIEEDLQVNDQIQFMFRTYLVSMMNEKCIQLDIVKIIKYVPEDSPVDDQQPIIEDDTEHVVCKINYDI